MYLPLREIQGRTSEYWVCQDLANIQRYDVAGSEAVEYASSLEMTNVPYLKNNFFVFADNVR